MKASLGNYRRPNPRLMHQKYLTRINNRRYVFIIQFESPVFQTCEEERDKVILQLGTASPERAVKAALLVHDHVAGIDVNMGCPKEYSTKGGMGAALMKNPENAVAILTALVKACKIPVTAKIRCFETIEKTIEFAKKLEATGIVALAVHGRLKEERPRQDCRYDTIKAVSNALNIPVLSNGGSNDFSNLVEIQEFQKRTETDGVLVARAAMWNPSIFNEKGPRPMEDVIIDYIKICMKYKFCYELMKYNILNVMRGKQDTDLRGIKTRAALTSQQIADAWNVKPLEDDRNLEGEPDSKRAKIIETHYYDRNHFKMNKNWPKQSLEHFLKNNQFSMKKPNYENLQRKSDSRYQSTMTLW